MSDYSRELREREAGIFDNSGRVVPITPDERDKIADLLDAVGDYYTQPRGEWDAVGAAYNALVHPAPPWEPKVGEKAHYAKWRRNVDVKALDSFQACVPNDGGKLVLIYRADLTPPKEES